MPVRTESSGFGTAFRMAIVFIALSVLALIAAPVLGLSARIPFDYNEGWNAYAALRALGLSGGPLYPAPGGLIANNYPPLSFFVTGVLGWLTGDMIIAGRIIALVSLLTSAGLAGAVSRRCGPGGWGVAAAVLLPLLYVAAFSHDYVAMDDPQWFGIAIMLSAVLIFVSAPAGADGRPDLRAPRLIATAALMVTAGMVKHNVLSWPAAVTFQLAVMAVRRRDWRPFGVWLISGAAFAAFAVGLCVVIFGPVFLTDVLHHSRVINPALMLSGARRTSEILSLGLVSLTLIGRRPSVPHGGLLARAAACSILWTLIQRTGEGVALNAWFEPLIVLSILTGVAISAAGQREHGLSVTGPARFASRVGPAGLLGIALVPFLIGAWVLLPRAVSQVVHLKRDARAWDVFVDEVRRQPGQVGCSMAAICYWAGKDNLIDVFNYSEYVANGGSRDPFVALLGRPDLAGFVIPVASDGSHFRHRNNELLRQKALLAPVYDRDRPGPVSPDGKLRLYLPVR
ncbi:hypothetical protein [Acetobacter fallax]|uniref:Glycosyltransferase RgtA/B/C/D-like domain-containing protein n=1 Tax=Acetobacter fallax TaxID=1737473 RepID=A0ABX0KAA5_9PROT|nr:hypothetical protein [Acetobacter fallax]NHO33369.1 hypothetical protein [Acetobacter fallax]NHO36988.1 hypothetical protein [Acetobacter fallax]